MEGESSSVSVLVVEDEPTLRLLIEEEFLEAGFRVVTARSADEALSTPGRYDVLFTDVRLPGQMDGLELAALLKRSSRCGGVIYATGYSYSPPRMVSPSVVFRKPYSVTSAVVAVRQMAELTRGRAERMRAHA